MDNVYTSIIFVALAIVAFVLWCSLKVASDFDDISEKEWEAFLERNQDERTEEN